MKNKKIRLGASPLRNSYKLVYLEFLRCCGYKSANPKNKKFKIKKIGFLRRSLKVESPPRQISEQRSGRAQKLNCDLIKYKEKILSLLTYISSLISFSLLLILIIFLIIKGIPNLSFDLFSLNYNSENVSMFPAIITTIYIIILTLLISVPLGVGTAIYLVEYTSKKNKFVKLIRLATETLAGIPSIVYGLFGMLFFVSKLNLNFSIISGSLTLSIMVLPLIIRTTEESLKAVPDGYREGAYGLGAGKLRTILKIVLPSSILGILTGIILAIGRVIGETAALIYTAGTVAKIPTKILDSARTLSVHVYNLSSEGLHTDEAYATAFILILIIILLNIIIKIIGRRTRVKI